MDALATSSTASHAEVRCVLVRLLAVASPTERDAIRQVSELLRWDERRRTPSCDRAPGRDDVTFAGHDDEVFSVFCYT